MASRNIIISDKNFAIDALNNMSYYTLVNGYKDTFLAFGDGEMFIPGTKFEDLYTIHIIDTNLNSILFKYILHIEQSLKSKLSYIVSKNYGVYSDFFTSSKTPDDYLYLKNYSPSNGRRKNILDKINNCGLVTRDNLSIEHYKRTKNHIPPWILIGNVPFGLTIQWYSILKNEDKTYVCENMVNSKIVSVEEKKEFLFKSLDILKNYRNSMAHGIRTFADINKSELPMTQTLTLAKYLVTKNEFLAGMGKKNLYALIISICILTNDSYLSTNFYADLLNLFQGYIQNDIKFCNNTVLEVFGLPNDILDRIWTFISHKYIH